MYGAITGDRVEAVMKIWLALGGLRKFTENISKCYGERKWRKGVCRRRWLEGGCVNWSEVTDLQKGKGSSELQASGTASMKVMI